MTHVVTLLGKPGCHLCDDAREVIARVTAQVGASWVERDVTADPGDYAEYGDRIPVILIDGREHGYWRVEEERLRVALNNRRLNGGTARGPIGLLDALGDSNIRSFQGEVLRNRSIRLTRTADCMLYSQSHTA